MKRMKRQSFALLVTFMMFITSVFPSISLNTLQKPEVQVDETQEVVRRFASGSGNDNGANVALLELTNSEVGTPDNGELSFTFTPRSTKTDTRFGVYLRYVDKNNFVFVGVDASSNWFYEYKVNGSGSYPQLGVSAPNQGDETTLKVKWEDNNMWVDVNGTPTNSGNPYTINALQSIQADKVYLKAGSYKEAVSDVLFKNVTYKNATNTITNNTDTWKLATAHGGEIYEAEYEEPVITEVNINGVVQDVNENPLHNAKVKLGELVTTTNAQGQFVFQNVTSGKYNMVISKPGYQSHSFVVEAKTEDLDFGIFRLPAEEEIEVSAPEHIQSGDMKVGIDTAFPRVIYYEMKGDLAGRKFYGQTEELSVIKINGKEVTPTVTLDKVESTKATYTLTAKDTANDIDCVLTAVLSVDKNTLSFNITNVVDNKIVKTIEIPNHSLVSVRNTQSNANFAGSQVSTNTHKTGDRFYTVDQMANGVSGYTFGFVSNHSLSAGLWSNSENNVSADWQRVSATATTYADYKSVGLSSTRWTYQKDTAYRKENTAEELPCARVIITGDANDDAEVDWQDGAIAYREIMKNPLGYESIPDLVAMRISMNFGSMAQNPFLMTLDNVKKVYLHTDGLGQTILLKGYGSEGHDSGHLNYADIGTRIGGATDMKTLLKEGKKYGATFGVHVNASETYPESKYFDEDRLLKDANGNYKYGWNWLDQGINIDAAYDLLHGRAERFKDFYEALGGADNDLDFIYVDVWGNGQSGDNGTWASSQLAKEITNLGWRVAGEWGHAFNYDSTFQHWATDLTYGGYSNKGVNSSIARFIQNHQKDSWVGDYPSYGGAAINPLLGGYDMKDFEGWQGRNDYEGYMQNLFEDNIASKFVQHFKVTKWENGTPVTMTDNGETYQWTPEMKITLKEGNDTLVIERQSNDVASAGYRLRTMTFNDKVVMDGEKYLLPWNWDESGNALANADEKLYHYNKDGGTSTWAVPEGWNTEAIVYELSEDGKINPQTVSIIDGKISITATAGKGYVVYKGAKSNKDVSWSEYAHIVDTGFNSGNLDAWDITGETSGATITKSQASNRMLTLNNTTDEVKLSQKITGLTPGQKYAAYVGVDNRSDAKAFISVEASGETISNYTTRSIAKNYISAAAHNTNSSTVNNSSYFQNMYVFFTAPSDGSDVILTLSREAKDGYTYFDDIRVFENESETMKDGKFVQDFEDVPQGIYPFVVGGVEGVSDNRTHLSEKHEPYTQRGWNGKKIDDVIEGNWSLKTNGLVNRSKLVYQTIPQNFRFEENATYMVSFDYEVGTTGAYAVMVGDGEFTSASNLTPLTETYSKDKAQHFQTRVTGSTSGQTWIGIYSTNVAADLQGDAGGNADFRGYKDIMLDNLVIEKVIADGSELISLIDANKNKVEVNYSESSWETFTDAVNDGKALLEKADATQAQIDEAVDTLTDAINELELVANTVNGTIREGGKVQPNVEVIIDVANKKVKATTNDKGYYEVHGVAFGTHDLTVDHKYFDVITDNVTTSSANEVVTKDIELTRLTNSVTAKATAVGEIAPSASVILEASDGTVYNTTTDSDGNFAFADLATGLYKIKIEKPETGYDLYNGELQVIKGEPLTKHFMIEPESRADYINTFDDATTWDNLAGNNSSTTIQHESGQTKVKFPSGHANVYDTAAPTFKNGTVEMDVTSEGDGKRLGILLRANDMANRVYIGTGDTSNQWFAEYWGKNGNKWSSMYNGPSFTAGKTLHIKVEIIDTRMRLWVDGQQIFDQTMSGVQLEAGKVGMNTRVANTVKIDNVVVTSYDPPIGDVEVVAGKIVNNGTPVVGKSVTLYAQSPLLGSKMIVSALGTKSLKTFTTSTDANGNYKFKNVAFGNAYVVVDNAGTDIRTDFTVKSIEDGYVVVPCIDLANPPVVVDKTALESTITDAEALTEADYTADSWAVLEDALADAKAVVADTNATQQEVDDAKAALENAINDLVTVTVVDKTALESTITEAEALTEADYTADSWAVLEDALADAKAVVADT
ncbi:MULTISPECIES: endo-alpha-N-acetylgalactosaminidase family protein, partial [unclassified Breznakia]